MGQWRRLRNQTFNAINGDLIGEVSSKGIDYKSVLEYGRSVGGPALRKMTFQERANVKGIGFLSIRKERPITK